VIAAELLASDLTVAVWFGAAGAALAALATIVAAVVVEAVGDGDAVGDVERFLELSAEAHYSRLADGPLLGDPGGEASEAIGELLARKERAREALWASREAASLRAPAATEAGTAIAAAARSPSPSAPAG
jgi:hypothetical protein